MSEPLLLQSGESTILTLTQKKEWARELYIRDELTQKAIAEKVGVSEQTMVAWVKDNRWDGMRKTLLSTRQEQIQMLYDILDGLNKEAKAAVEDDDPATKPNTDAIIKIANAIKKLEKETGLGEIIDTCRALIAYTLKEDNEAAKIINKWADLFIRDRLTSANL